MGRSSMSQRKKWGRAQNIPIARVNYPYTLIPCIYWPFLDEAILVNSRTSGAFLIRVRARPKYVQRPAEIHITPGSGSDNIGEVPGWGHRRTLQVKSTDDTINYCAKSDSLFNIPNPQKGTGKGLQGGFLSEAASANSTRTRHIAAVVNPGVNISSPHHSDRTRTVAWVLQVSIRRFRFRSDESAVCGISISLVYTREAYGSYHALNSAIPYQFWYA